MYEVKYYFITMNSAFVLTSYDPARENEFKIELFSMLILSLDFFRLLYKFKLLRGWWVPTPHLKEKNAFLKLSSFENGGIIGLVIYDIFKYKKCFEWDCVFSIKIKKDQSLQTEAFTHLSYIYAKTKIIWRKYCIISKVIKRFMKLKSFVCLIFCKIKLVTYFSLLRVK